MKFKIVILISFSLFFSCKNKILEKDGMILLKGNEKLNDFWMDVSPVTVAQFEKFVNETKYKTEAEKFGDAGVFDFETGTWYLKKHATWKFPFGIDEKAALPNHPVTQVSWNDAIAYCKWAKKRLPTNEEYTFAEKNCELDFDKTYSWGDNFKENDAFKANFWQGSFPYKNNVQDGFLTTSPVAYFGKNEIGLTDIGGNVWQWCMDESKEKLNEKLQRGGSYLCDPSICHGFKIGGSSSSTAETSLCHVGFRCVKDAN